DPFSFQYRLKGENSWISVDAVRNGNQLTAAINGLTPGKTYEYRAVSGTTHSSTTLEFTTESEFIIPNAGFENFHTKNKVLLMYGSGESMWWDSGNHGSATLNKNITTQDTSIKNSGNSSLKMKSQFVGVGSIGKFAAGNVFAGTYSGTDGTNGILDFGRPFNSRPSKLKGYYKYVTGEVDYSETNSLPKGSPNDVGSIYVAIGDWEKPVHITTKDKNLFSKDDEHIIGYGEILQTANTEGDGLIPFTIDIEYRSTDRVPTYIILVASASFYGDYFTGSSASTMWLDDLEFVYE
ncbi:MAG: PCMD domain-containing protein, partial [Bacteroidales bacterium]|nr:PCMD domain-containing protein [Bacteroidales bacterium]